MKEIVTETSCRQKAQQAIQGKNKSENTIIWLDDSRNPFENNKEWLRLFSPVKPDGDIVIVWLQSYSQFKKWVKKNGLPRAICFDHDLGDINDKTEKTGYDCAQIIGEYCLEHNTDVPAYSIQSSNPAGRENIDKYLKNVQNFINKNKQENENEQQ